MDENYYDVDYVFYSQPCDFSIPFLKKDSLFNVITRIVNDDLEKFRSSQKESVNNLLLNYSTDNDPKRVKDFFDKIKAETIFDNRNPSKAIFVWIMMYVSNLFDVGINLKDNTFFFRLKDEYNGKTEEELFEIYKNNIQKIKIKDLSQYCINFSVNYVIDYLNSMEKKAFLVHCNAVLNNTGVIPLSLVKDDNYAYLFDYFYVESILKKGIESSDIEIMYSLLSIRLDLMNISDFYNVRFNYPLNDGKTLLMKEDLISIREKIDDLFVSTYGEDKYDEMLSFLESAYKSRNFKYGTQLSELMKEFIENFCINNKSIDEEVKIIQSKIKTTKKSDPVYKQLENRLRKLLLYKEMYGSEKVLTGTGLFDGYYGFDFDGVYVFDYFVDSEEDTLDKAKRENGNAIYILTFEDYDIVKKLPNKMEARKYINSKLKPYADYLNHGDNFENRLKKKLSDIKSSIEVKNLINKLLNTDNPITEEEIGITEEELNKYAYLSLPKDEDELSKVYDKLPPGVLKKIVRKKIIAKVVDKDIKESTEDAITNSKIINKDIDEVNSYLEEINEERRKKGLKELSYEEDSFFEVYEAIMEYKKEHNIKKKVARDPQVALYTKARVNNNGLCKCELCDELHTPDHVESHHFIPISDGGPDNIYNTVCLCLMCHADIHNGKVTDYNKYKLIHAIQTHMENETPEYLEDFNRILGPGSNFYLDKYDELQEEYIRLMEEENNKSNAVKMKELDARIKKMEEKYKLIISAHNNSSEFLKEKNKTK